MDETATGQAETSSHFRIQSPILRRSLVCVIVNPAVAVVAAPTPVAVALAALVVSKSGSVCDRLQKPVRENWRCPRLWAMPSLSSTQTPHLGGTFKLEALCHKESCFSTLTYDPNSLPTSISRSGGHEIPTLKPLDLQLWLKRLREAHQPLKLRFFAVGEYGDETHRPHYHVVLFGFRGCARGRTRRKFGTNNPDPLNCCDRCRLVASTWPSGNIELGEFNTKTAAYVASYTVKKLTGWDDPRLDGQHPEFARMSLKPGIGADSLWEYAHSLLHFNLDQQLDDVPNLSLIHI